MLKQFPTSQFKKDYKLVMKRGLNLEKLKDVMKKLAEETPLDTKFKNYKQAFTIDSNSFKEFFIPS